MSVKTLVNWRFESPRHTLFQQRYALEQTKIRSTGHSKRVGTGLKRFLVGRSGVPLAPVYKNGGRRQTPDILFSPYPLGIFPIAIPDYYRLVCSYTSFRRAPARGVGLLCNATTHRRPIRSTSEVSLHRKSSRSGRNRRSAQFAATRLL